MKRMIKADCVKVFDEYEIETEKPLEEIVNALVAKYANKGFMIRSEKDSNDTSIIIMRKNGMFKSVPGLESFIYIKLDRVEASLQPEGSIRAEAGVFFETDSGLQTSLLMQSLIGSTMCIDPAPVLRIPRYDKMLFSLTHKSVIERNIGIAVRSGLCEDIFKNLSECGMVAGTNQGEVMEWYRG